MTLHAQGTITLIYTFDTTARRALGRRVAKWIGSLGVVAMLFVAPLFATLATNARGAGLPANIVTSSSPDDTVINKYITDAVNDLKSNDPAKQQSGRDAIVNFAPAAANPVVPSPAFQTAFSRNLNRQLPAVAKAPEMRSRLNAAIATARIAEKIENDELAPTIAEFLKDKDEAVAIWAMKAAKFVIPRGANGAKLIPQVVDTAMRFPGSTTQAYEALTTGETPIAGVVDQVHRLMDARIKSYGNGIPADSLAERISILKLVDGKWWAAQTAAQQKKTVQALVDLTDAAAKRVVMNVSNEERESMSALVRHINRAFGAIAERAGKQALRQKMDERVRGLVAGAQPNFIAQQADAMVAAVLPEFPGIVAPKAPAAPAPGAPPATKPAAAPK